MKKPTQHHSVAVTLLIVYAVFAAITLPIHAQVTIQQVTNGLVSYYPLDFLSPDGKSTPDLITRRDMVLFGMGQSNVVASTRPGGATSNCFNFTQAGSGTVIYYASAGQDALTGGGDFLPFCNKINASMNFWVKLNGLTVGSDKRFFGECDNTGSQANPLWLIGTSSGTADTAAHWLMRQQDATGPGGSTTMSDGTYEFPVIGTRAQANNSTSAAHPLLDGNWHMFTVTIDTNASYAVYVDGVLDTGPATDGTTQNRDAYGNPSILGPLYVTNLFYTTNIYPAAGVSNPPPNGFVKWVFNGMLKTGSTTFGGFKRGAVSAGAICQIDDIGFWNRALSPAEVSFVMTNGLPNLSLNTNTITLGSFTADLGEIGSGDQVTLRWNVTGASRSAGGITISGVGDVTAIGPVGTTNLTLKGNQTYTFTLTAHNGIVPDQTATVSVKSFPGVSSDWHLIQRFDGLFSDTTLGISGNGWISTISDFTGVNRDRWNVLTLTNGSGLNKVLTPRTGYAANPNAVTGFESRGALAYGLLNGLTMGPTQSNTLFFRFSLKEPPQSAGLISDMDFGVGLSDFNFIGPLSGAAGPGQAGQIGPYFSIIRNSQGAFTGAPIDLYAKDYSGSAITNTYSYLTANPNGLQTNVNYFIWMDIANDNTHAVTNSDSSTATANEPRFSVWLQKQGDASRTRLFTNFHGNRDFVGFNPVVDSPTPFLNKLFVSIADESIVNGATGSYVSTNMIAVDDFYLSKNGFSASIPKLFDIRSVVKGATNATITWDSLGSMYQTNTYTIQRKLQLSDSSWSTLTSGLASGGDTTTYTDNTVGSSTMAYYRISWP